LAASTLTLKASWTSRLTSMVAAPVSASSLRQPTMYRTEHSEKKMIEPLTTMLVFGP